VVVNMGVDVSQLRELAQRVSEAGPLWKRAKEKCAAAAISRTRRAFSAGADPYGVPWLPPQFRAGRPLRDTGRLNNSISTEVTSDGFRIGTTVEYARPHQFGAVIKPKKAKALRFPVPIQGPQPKGVGRPNKRQGGIGSALVFARAVTIPARPFLPTEARGLPPAWVDDFARIIRAELRRMVAGGQ
jgi:phage gpG-like protein